MQCRFGYNHLVFHQCEWDDTYFKMTHPIYRKLKLKETPQNIAQNAATHPGTFLCEPALNSKSRAYHICRVWYNFKPMKTLELHDIIRWSSFYLCVLSSFCSMECGFLLAVLQWWQEISNSLPKHFIVVFHLIVRYNTNKRTQDCPSATPFNVWAVFRLLSEKMF